MAAIGLTSPSAVGRVRMTLLLWAFLVLAPMAAYAMPLWQNALADTPVAYLIWIPVLALAWAAWNLSTTPEPYPDDRELNVLVGGAAAVMVGTILAIGPERWPVELVYYAGGLLLWPAWALSITWLFFGIGVTRRVLAPFVYWLVGWPPIFTWIADRTQGILVGWAIAALNVFGHWVTWIRPSFPTGNFLVAHGGQWVGVVIAQACSGADSLLGAAILLPLIFAVLKGPLRSAFLLAGVALIGALVLNWLRLFILLGSVHWIGPAFTFSWLHPVLGFILFGVLGMVLAALSGPLGLKFGETPRRVTLSLPGRTRIGMGAVFAVGLAWALQPLFQLPAGNAGNPRPVPTAQLAALMPRIAGFTESAVYRANESSVLGPHSATLADLYRAPNGASVLVELWSTPNIGSLESYGFRDCLVYHGDNVIAQHSFLLPNGLPATVYAVQLPPLQVGGASATYLDVEWTSAVKTPAGVRYLRWSAAAFPTSLGAWPTLVVRSVAGSPVAGLTAVGVPPDQGRWTPQLAGTRLRLSQFAGVLAAARVQHGVLVSDRAVVRSPSA
jgi:exosortase/archaeosortase family protein